MQEQPEFEAEGKFWVAVSSSHIHIMLQLAVWHAFPYLLYHDSHQRGAASLPCTGTTLSAARHHEMAAGTRSVIKKLAEVPAGMAEALMASAR